MLYRKEKELIKILRVHRAIRRSKLRLAERIVLSALIDLVDWQSWQCDASLRMIVLETSLSKSAITENLIRLEKQGFITRKRQGDERGHTKSAYKINIDALKEYLEQFYPLSTERTHLSAERTTPCPSNGPPLVHDVDNPLSAERTPNLSSISIKNNYQDNQSNKTTEDKENAQSASLEGEKKEVKRYPKGHFFAGAIMVDEDDWVPEKKKITPIDGYGWNRKNES